MKALLTQSYNEKSELLRGKEHNKFELDIDEKEPLSPRYYF